MRRTRLRLRCGSSAAATHSRDGCPEARAVGNESRRRALARDRRHGGVFIPFAIRDSDSAQEHLPEFPGCIHRGRLVATVIHDQPLLLPAQGRNLGVRNRHREWTQTDRLSHRKGHRLGTTPDCSDRDKGTENKLQNSRLTSTPARRTLRSQTRRGPPATQGHEASGSVSAVELARSRSRVKACVLVVPDRKPGCGRIPTQAARAITTFGHDGFATYGPLSRRIR